MATVNVAHEIPLTPTPQRFSISLGGVTYQLRSVWNPLAQAWVVDIADSSGQPIVSGIPLVCGANLLEQFDYLGIGGELIAQSDNDPNVPPTFNSLGSTGHLYFVALETV